MKARYSTSALLAVAVIAFLVPSPESKAQSALQSLAPHSETPGFDLAVTYTAERGKIASTPCQCFWMEGGGVDAAFTLYHGLGLAASFTGQHASGLTGGANLNKVDFLFGPRYTLQTSGRTDSARYSTRLFGEALFGGVHAFNSTFPAPSQASTTAGSYAYQLGGGVDLSLNRHMGFRIIEVSFFHSALPNNASNTQDDIRLAAGISYRIGRH